VRDNEIRSRIAEAVHGARKRRLGLDRCVQLYELVGDHLAEVGASTLGHESQLGGNPSELHEARHMMTDSFAKQFRPLVADEMPETLLVRELEMSLHRRLPASSCRSQLCIALEGRSDATGLDLYQNTDRKLYQLFEGHWIREVGTEFSECISSILRQFPINHSEEEPMDTASPCLVNEPRDALDIRSIAKNGILRSYEYAPDYTIAQAEILTVVIMWEPYRRIVGRRGIYLGKPMIDLIFVKLHEKGVPISGYLRGSFLVTRYPWSKATMEAYSPLASDLVLRTDPIPEDWITVFLGTDEGIRIVRPEGSWTRIVWEAYDEVCKVDTSYGRFKQGLGTLIPEIVSQLKGPKDFWAEMERIKKTISGSKWLCGSFTEVAGCSRSGQ